MHAKLKSKVESNHGALVTSEIAAWFCNAVVKSGRESTRQASEVWPLLFEISGSGKPELVERLAIALGRNVKRVNASLDAIIRRHHGVRPEGLWYGSGIAFTKQPPKQMGQVLRALVAPKPDKALQGLLVKHKGKLPGFGLATFSQIAFAVRPDLYFVCNKVTSKHLGRLLKGRKYGDYVEVSRQLRHLCDSLQMSGPRAFFYLDTLLASSGPWANERRRVDKLIAQFAQIAALGTRTPNSAFVTRVDKRFAHTQYVPSGDFEFSRELRLIKARLGQKPFRQALLSANHGRCQVTGCSEQFALEAAHIFPFKGPRDHHPENGLLLRADLHTLFDLGLLRICAETLKIEIDEKVVDAGYRKLHGSSLRLGRYRPSKLALQLRHSQFPISR
jgi:hypothetical protein